MIKIVLYFPGRPSEPYVEDGYTCNEALMSDQFTDEEKQEIREQHDVK